MSKEAIYPKDDPEYRKRIMDQFYKKVKETKWDNDYEDSPKRGRKSKSKYKGREKAQPRKSEKYKWF
jgi:hypothetical protein